MKKLLLTIAFLLTGCMMVHSAQRIVLSPASRIAFDYDPRMATSFQFDANAYIGSLTVDGTAYAIPSWDGGCTTTTLTTCLFSFPSQTLPILNTIGAHTLALKLVNKIDATLIGPDSDVITWNSVPAPAVPFAPVGLKILP